MEKSSRPVRNRKQSRRIWPTGDITHRPVKRLFTPDIKKMLKEWLIRRRDNPYPSRDEKKSLAYETGLTYTQICNWFANWRRKLKNSGKEPIRRSWGNLIKNYNTSAKGNVEQFSISSGDSIWEEEEQNAINNYINDDNDDDNDDDIENDDDNEDDDDDDDDDSFDDDNDSIYSSDSYENDNINKVHKNHKHHKKHSKNSYDLNNNCLELYNREPYYPPGYYFMNPSYQYQKEINNNLGLNEQINMLTVNQTKNFEENTINNQQNYQMPQEQMQQQQNELQQQEQRNQLSFTTNTKYKQQMMEKYLKDTNNCYNNQAISPNSSANLPSSSPELSKWLESAAKFTPNKNNYIEWNCNLRGKHVKKLPLFTDNCINSAVHIYGTIHQKEELEAAEALTNLACNYRMKMMNTIESQVGNCS